MAFNGISKEVNVCDGKIPIPFGFWKRMGLGPSCQAIVISYPDAILIIRHDINKMKKIDYMGMALVRDLLKDLDEKLTVQF